MTSEERWREQGLCGLVKRWLREDVNAVYPSFMGGCRKDRTRVLHAGWARGSRIGLGPDHVNFWSGTRKNVFLSEGGQALEQRTGDIMEFTALESKLSQTRCWIA